MIEIYILGEVNNILKHEPKVHISSEHFNTNAKINLQHTF